MASRLGKLQRSLNSSQRVHDSRRRRRPTVEVLEPRVVLSTFTVNSTAPTTGTGSGIAGDLRYCINQADADNQANTIVFDSTVSAPTRRSRWAAASSS